MSFIILDVQGFQIEDGKTFIPKELAAFNGKQISHHVFKPPFQYSFLDLRERRNVLWIEKNYHGILWNVGYTDFEEFSTIVNDVCENYETIYVKGREKATFLNSYLKDKNIIQYPENEEPSLKKFIGKPKCFCHRLSFAHCALSNVYLMYNYLET